MWKSDASEKERHGKDVRHEDVEKRRGLTKKSQRRNFK